MLSESLNLLERNGLFVKPPKRMNIEFQAVSERTAEMPTVCVFSSWPHTHLQQGGDTVLKSPTDLIMSTLNRKSPPLHTLTPLKICLLPHGPIWSKYPALISTRRSFARGLLNINYISIFLCDNKVASYLWSSNCDWELLIWAMLSFRW